MEKLKKGKLELKAISFESFQKLALEIHVGHGYLKEK